MLVAEIRDFGDVWLPLGLWRLLGLDKRFAELMPPGREEVPWEQVATILVIARFCAPSSELHIADTWHGGTALEDLLGVTVAQVYHRRLYAGLDHLLPHKQAIEKHLKERLGDLFDLNYDLLLYDVTSTYFEGECQANPKAKRGYSRDSRPDCLQICIGLVVTTDGIPLGYEVFDGNTNDSKTVEPMVQAMLRRFEQYLTEQDWHEVQPGVEVKLVPGPDGQETFILARSADRRAKEQAMHQRFLDRMEEGLAKLQRSIESGRLKEEAVAQRRLGRLQQRCWRAAGAFEVTIQPLTPPQGKVHLAITWKQRENWHEWAALSEGCYLLRTNLIEVDPATLWKRYIQLTEAERRHRRRNRVRSHGVELDDPGVDFSHDCTRLRAGSNRPAPSAGG